MQDWLHVLKLTLSIYIMSIIYVFCRVGTLTISMLIDMAGFIPYSFILCAGYYFYNKNR